jgi:hypothetical protein
LAISSRAQQAVNNINNRNLSASGNVKIPETYQVDMNDTNKNAPDTIDSSIISYLTFESVGGQELLLLSRTDLLNGISVAYQPIQNITDIAFQYAPSNIISLPENLSAIFKQYGLSLENYVPEIRESDPKKSYSGYNDSPNAYLDNDSGSETYRQSIFIEFKDMQPYMVVELQVMDSGDSSEDSFGL